MIKLNNLTPFHPLYIEGKLDGNKLKILAIQEENNETILFERLDLVSILKKLWQVI